MPSLFAQYLLERTDDLIVENDLGFVVYRFLDPTTCFIVDLYVIPEHRLCKVATFFANHVEQVARLKGCKTLKCTVITSAKGWKTSQKAVEAYGFVLDQQISDVLVYQKEIK